VKQARGSSTDRRAAVAVKKSRHAAPKVQCPNCSGDVHCIRSRQMTDLIREITYQCLEDDCGIRFVAQLIAVRIIRSAWLREDLDLPVVLPPQKTHPPPPEEARAA
jgi:hypothetical protein